MVKIVAICHSSYYGYTTAGGAEVMLHQLLTHLIGCGWEAEAIVLGKPEPPVVVDGVKVSRARGESRLTEACRGADLIISHLGASMIAKKVGYTLGIKVVQLVHNTNEYTVGFLGSGCDFAIYNSLWVKEFHEGNIRTIIKRVDSDKKVSLTRRVVREWPSIVVRPPVTSDDIRNTIGPDGYVTLVNLVPNKGPEVFYELAERNPRIKFMGVIGGYEKDHQVVRNDLNNVTIHPHTRDMSSVYGNTSVVLMPSTYESYGKVVIEAAQYGVPAIASPTPGLKEALGIQGWFREKTDIDAWDQALKWTLDNYDARSAEAHQRYHELFEQSQEDLLIFEEAMKGLV